MNFAKAFRRHVDCPDIAVEGTTVRQALSAYFDAHPPVRAYVLDESSTLRRHIAVFVNDRQLIDRRELSDPVAETDVIHVFQALSGG